AALGVPLDVADVPLQRMVLPVDNGGERGHQRLPEACRSSTHLPSDQGAPRHALLRRSDRAQYAGERTTRTARGNHAPCERDGGRRRATIALTRRVIPSRSSGDRKSTRLNSSHVAISYAVFCLKKKKQTTANT